MQRRSHIFNKLVYTKDKRGTRIAGQFSGKFWALCNVVVLACCYAAIY